MAIENIDFDVACDFFRTNLYKAFTLTYDQKLTMSALYNQAKHGPFNPDKASDIGMFDFVGKEHRAKWQSLAQMSKVEAQDTFVQTLIKICPQFGAHLEAALCMPDPDVPAEASTQADEPVDYPPLAPHRINGEPQAPTSLHQKLDLKQIFSSQQESQIRKALNVQTIDQFREYAARYHPDDPAKQQLLISQLQDRHFYQYTQYLTQASIPQPQSMKSPSAAIPTPPSSDAAAQSELAAPPDAHVIVNVASEVVSEPSSTSPVECNPHPTPSLDIVNPVVEHAAVDSTQETMVTESGLVDSAKSLENRTSVIDDQIPEVQLWTQKEIEKFKALLVQDPESVINVGSGELVTIRVPSVPTRNSIVWEFATDDYDIGFGLFFEGIKPKSSTTTPPPSSTPVGDSLWKNLIQGSSEPLTDAKKCQLSENDEKPGDVEVVELIPITRYASHTEVYCGYHTYPCEGTYLLKFDNTYSIWRSKVLYYRVYSTAA